MAMPIRPPLDDEDEDDIVDGNNPGEMAIPPYYGEMDRAVGRQFPAPGYDLNEYPPFMAQPLPPGLQYEDISQQVDPRAEALDRMFGSGQVQRPGMKGEEDYQAQFGEGSGPSTLGNNRKDEYMPPSPDQRREADEAAQMSDEELMEQVQKGMNSWQLTGDFKKDSATLERLRASGDQRSYQELKDLMDDFYEDEKNMQEQENIDEPDTEDDLRRGR